MGFFLIWNSNSLRPTAEGNNKGDYLCRKLKELNSVDLVCVAETHLADNCENQRGAWYAQAVDRAVIRKLEKIKILQGFKKSCNKVKGKFAMSNTRNVS